MTTKNVAVPGDSPLQKAMVALDRMKAKLDAIERERSEPIAIIGMACRFPGGARTPEAFFDQLMEGRDAVTEVPPDRWSADTTGLDPAFHGVRWGGFIEEVDRFDPAFFGISPREAERTDPQQRLLLELTWEALEGAGQVPGVLSGSKTGVFVGAMTTDYMLLSLQAPPEAWDAYTATGTPHCFPAGRIAYTFGFQGPTMVVDTACSSSLVATHLACQSLRFGESDLAVVGGVNLMLAPQITEMSGRMRALSPDGRCKTFDARADGYVRGEGGGVVVLKRLRDAQRDRDPILALIRGSAVNQDGRSTGLTAPNVISQQAMLRQALTNARVAAEDIGYVETHGTGTSLGDPIEFEALRAVLGKQRPDGGRCVLGAVKTNIGHLEAAAGVAGLIKAVMVLSRGVIPKNLHFRALNPRISLEDTPFVIPTASVPWHRGDRARLAGVSGFGLSGTNAHMILQEAPAPPPASTAAESSHILPLSAKSAPALRALARSFAELLAEPAGASLADVVFTATTRRAHHEHRLAVVSGSREEASAALAALARVDTAPEPLSTRPRVVFIFPGQGSQWLGMGRQLLASEPVFHEAMRASDEAIQRHGGFSVLEELGADEGRSRLDDIGVVQPVLFAVEVALAALWASWGVVPAVIVGHSMGEIAAAHVAGALVLDDAARIICRRSHLLRRLQGRGAMALVELSLSATAEALVSHRGELDVAVSNGPRSTVISGAPGVLDEVLASLSARGVFVRRVKVDVASHSPQMDALREELVASLEDIRPTSTRLLMRSTVTGELVRGAELNAAYWARNLRDPVLFSAVTQKILAEGPAIFLELSPHPVLLPAVEENLQGSFGAIAASLRRGVDERRSMLEGLAALYTRGVAVNWDRIHSSGGRCVPLPAYPWQRQRYWLEQTAAPRLTRVHGGLDAAPQARLPDGWLLETRWDRAPALAPRPETSGFWLVLADQGGIGAALAAQLREAGGVCVCAKVGATLRQLEETSWELDPQDHGAYAALLSAAAHQRGPLRGVVHLLAAEAPLAGATGADDIERSQHLGPESVLLLAQALLRAELPRAPRLSIVTRGVVALGHGDAPSAAQAPLWGFVRSLQTEHPELRCQILDLPPVPEEITPALLVALSTELADGGDEDQVALRSGGRFVPRLVRGAARPTRSMEIRSSASYLVTGGLGGLGLSVAEWLVKRGARHLVLAGRSAPSEAACAILSRLRSAGARVVVEAVDVSRRDDVEAMIGRIRADLPALRGVIHAAGVLRDRTLLELSVEAMRAVAAPKVWGAWNLHQATRDDALDFFVLYSSAASMLGSPGQANYAAANAFLDALAFARQRLGLPALSISWGPFAEAGLAAAQSNRGERLAARGFQSISLAEGTAALDVLLQSAAAHVAVLPIDIDRAAEALPRLMTAPYFAKLPRAHLAARSDDSRVPPIDELRRAAPDARASLLEPIVLGAFARITRLSPQQVDRLTPFLAYGFDSLMGLELRNRLQSMLGITLSMADILTHARVDALAGLLAERLVPSVEADVSPVAAPGSWIVIPRPSPAARLRLFCFPYAGGAAAIFAGWAELLPPEIELCAIQLPGRHERLHEPLLETVEHVVQALVPALLPYLDRPFATFGHCLGAIVMFEVLQALAERTLTPVHIFASGAPAPDRYFAPSMAARSTEELTDVLRAIGFARTGVLDDPDAGRSLLPAVRADFEAAARYTFTDGPLLTAPITAIAGLADPFAPPQTVDDWRKRTSSWSSKIVLPGEHYFIVPERAALVATLSAELLFRLAAQEQSTEANAAGVWLRVLPASKKPRVRVFCYPRVGQGSEAFGSWPSLLGDEVEVCVIEPPGTGDRASERPLGRSEEIVDRLAPVMADRLDLPCVFVGIDLGALVMFDLVRELRRRSSSLPGHLVVVGAVAPALHHQAPLHLLPREKLDEGLRFRGLAAEGLRYEPALRAECAALAGYTCTAAEPLALPITALYGIHDPVVPAGAIRAWSRETTDAFSALPINASHDLLSEAPSAVVAVVRDTLSALRYPPRL